MTSRAWRGSLSLPHRVASAAVIVVSGTTIATLGVPPYLMLVGVCAFVAVVNRACTALSGPVAWAAAIVAEASILLGESALMAVVRPHPDPQWVYVVMLLIPIAVALAVYWKLISVVRPRHERRAPAVSAEGYLAAVCIVLIEVMFEAIKLHGHDFGLTWFMGGDGRNHVVADRGILNAGGITLHEMKNYPALYNALAAIVDGAGGRANVTSGVLLVRDVQAMTAMVIVACIGIALCFIAALSELFPRGKRWAHRLPLYLWVPLGACGSIAIGAFVLSLAASGGFFSAMGCLVFTVASVALGLRVVQDYHHATLIALTLALALVVGSWTFLFVVPAVALVGGYIAGSVELTSRRHPLDLRQRRVGVAVLGASALCLVAVVAVLVAERSTLAAQVRIGGGIVGPNPRLFDWLGFVLLAVIVLGANARQRFARLLLLAEFAILAITVSRIHSVHPGGVDWSYYATKMIWLATATLLWTPFILLIDVMRLANRVVRRFGWRVVSNVALSVGGSSGLLWGIGHETPFTFPLAWAWSGSTIPSPLEIQLVTEQARLGEPFVIWDYSSAFEDKLGNYWSALTWDYRPNGTEKAAQGPISFVNWAASEDETPAALCQITSEYRLRIVTRNPHLVSSLVATCPGYLGAPRRAP
jgi:hypothetical protein